MPKKAKTKSDKKYKGLLQLFDNIRFDVSINKFKIDNMKKLMRKYIDVVDTKQDEAIEAGEDILPGPTNATHIWYEEAKKYREQVIMLKASNERLKLENDMLKEKPSTD
tara:strand:+ start:305 stop:631 length:327 start_codon:yes stop_codon:yes gene_type:complete